MDTRDRVIAILAEQALLDPGDVRDDMTLAELGLGSLGLVEAIFSIEEAFDVAVPFNASAPGDGGFDVSSVAAIIRAVEGLVAARGADGRAAGDAASDANTGAAGGAAGA